jgi:hypothetical protein
MLKSHLRLFALFAAVLSLVVCSVEAATYTWEGDTSNLMSDGTNWTGDSIITTGVVGTDDMVFPAIGGSTLTTTPELDAAFSFPLINVTGGTYVFGGASTLTLNTVNTSPNTLGLFHTSPNPLTINAPFATVAGYVHSSGGGIVFNGAVTPGNNVNSANNWMQVDGSSDVSFNGAFSSHASASAANAVNQLYLGGTALNFNATAHMGNIGTTYTGRISLGVNSTGTISAEHNNSFGGRGGAGQGVQVLSTSSGKILLDPLAGGNTNLTLMDDLWFAGRLGDNVNNPHLVSANGNNIFQSNDPSTVTLAVNSTGSNATTPYLTSTIKTTGGSLEFVNASIGTNATSTSSGLAVNTGVYTYQFDTAANTSIKLTQVGSPTNVGIRQNSIGRSVSVRKVGAGTLINETTAATNAYTGNTTVAGGIYNLVGSHTGGGTYTVNNSGTLLVNGMVKPAVGSTVNIDAGGTLGGAGSVSTTNVNLNGNVSPGNQAVGTLTLGDSTLVVGNGSSSTFELLNTAGSHAFASGNDWIDMSFLDLSLVTDSATVSLNVGAPGGGNLSVAGDWVLMSFDNSNTGTFNPALMAINGVGPGYTANVGLVNTGGTTGDLVLTLTATSAGVAGDYNGNGVVDSADYVVWRKNQGTTGPPAPLVSQGNGNGDNFVDAADYDIWRGNFGDSSGSGAGAGLENGGTVPEPTSLALAGVIVTLASRYRFRFQKNR